MSDTIQRVTQLIELANDSGAGNEARNAALQACKLIKKHGLVVSVQASNPAIDIGDILKDAAVEAASRVTGKDVVDIFSKVISRKKR
jgi:hypothetical protein